MPQDEQGPPKTPAQRLADAGWPDEVVKRLNASLDLKRMREAVRLASLGLTAEEVEVLIEKGVPLDAVTAVKVSKGENAIIVNDVPRRMSSVRRCAQYKDGVWISNRGIQQFRPKTGGMLNRGGTPTRNPGAGATPKVVREKMREMFVENVSVLEKIAKDKKQPAAARLKAIDMMAEYGVGKASVVLDKKGEEQDVRTVFREVHDPQGRKARAEAEKREEEEVEDAEQTGEE